MRDRTNLLQPPVDRQLFRDAMSHMAAAVQIITTDGPAGLRGTTVTSVCSLSDTPATLLACLNAASGANARFDDNGVFAVNLLAGRSEPVARVFAGEGGLASEDRFETGRWIRLETGAPILDEALVGFDCRLVDSRLVATHRVLIGEVVAIHRGEPGNSLLYRDRGYLTL